jgi:peptide deformylase
MLTIRTHPDPILTTVGEKVKEPLSEEIQNLLPQMVVAMRQANGIGLAAQQIGKALQVCVIELDDVIYYIINPKITAYSKEESISEEGCLSIPGEFFAIKRPQKVQLRYTNEKGEKKKLRASGLLARAIQHELDHLNGVLIIDRLQDACDKQIAKSRIKF